MNYNDYFRYLTVGLPRDIQFRKDAGDFQKATELIDARLNNDFLPDSYKASLILQKEIIHRLPVSYNTSYDDALKQLQDLIPGFKKEQLDHYLDERLFDWIYIDNQIFVLDRFIGCLKKYDFFLKLLPDYKEVKPEERQVYKTVHRMKESGTVCDRITIEASIQVKDEFFKPGMKALVHLPIPLAYDQQSDIQIVKMSPANGILSSESSAQRTICWQETMTENHPFIVEYSYLSTSTYVDLRGKSGIDKNYDFNVEENEPHIVFTPYIRSLCHQLTDGITDPLKKAHAIYDFITKNMKYAFQPEYFVMDNIPETCAKSYRGDCGVFAITFITLCRCAGIPAYWQSGMAAGPDDVGSHDWACFYVEPFGWLHCDPSYGVACTRWNYEEGREFFFGNLDSYRMIANRDFQKPFEIEKTFWRDDPYDNQSGEFENEEHGFEKTELIKTQKLVSIEKIK